MATETLVQEDWVNQAVCVLCGNLAKYLQRRGFRQNAEDASHEVVCDICRQPQTYRFILANVGEILDGHVPTSFRRRGCAEALKLAEPREIPTDPNDCDCLDVAVDREQERLNAMWAVEELCERDPRLRKVVEAFRSGCDTRKEIAQHLGVCEETIYSWLRQARKTLNSHRGS